MENRLAADLDPSDLPHHRVTSPGPGTPRSVFLKFPKTMLVAVLTLLYSLGQLCP